MFDFNGAFREGHFSEGNNTQHHSTEESENEENVEPANSDEWIPLEHYEEQSVSDFMIQRQMRMVLNNTRDDYLPWDIDAAASLYNSLRASLSNPNSMPIAAMSVATESSNFDTSEVIQEYDSELLTVTDNDRSIVDDIQVLDEVFSQHH